MVMCGPAKLRLLLWQLANVYIYGQLSVWPDSHQGYYYFLTSIVILRNVIHFLDYFIVTLC